MKKIIIEKNVKSFTKEDVIYMFRKSINICNDFKNISIGSDSVTIQTKCDKKHFSFLMFRFTTTPYIFINLGNEVAKEKTLFNLTINEANEILRLAEEKKHLLYKTECKDYEFVEFEIIKEFMEL